MAKVQLENLGDEIERRILDRMRRLDRNSLQFKETMLRIGTLLETEMKFNIRRKQIVDTGRLLNSIKHELFNEGMHRGGVRVGSFGVPYAAQHEFGGPFTDTQRRAMFASLRRTGKLNRNKGSKGVIRGSFFSARPYFRPAIVKHRQRVMDLLKDWMRSTLTQ